MYRPNALHRVCIVEFFIHYERVNDYEGYYKKSVYIYSIQTIQVHRMYLHW